MEAADKQPKSSDIPYNIKIYVNAIDRTFPMQYLELIEKWAQETPDALAMQNSIGESITYAELWRASETLSQAFATAAPEPPTEGADVPVVVYGHKSPWMLVCFLAALKSGHPYVPIDQHSVPQARVGSIVEQVGAAIQNTPLVMDTTGALELETPATIWTMDQIQEAAAGEAASNRDDWQTGERLAYILFTSGSTGNPKGVMITASCFDNFLGWDLPLTESEQKGAYINQAPFSFDLSVYELAAALASGSTLYCLTKETQSSTKDMFEALRTSGARVWVSTPSFASVCLADASFTQEMMPDLRIFLFCGETLPNETVKKLMDRFPEAVSVNSYGPTESTVAVTAVTITREMAYAEAPLPVGVSREGTRMEIVAEDGSLCPAGTPGEMRIVGDTVARGYFNRPDLTEKVFGVGELNGEEVRTYRTGDEGYLDEDGMLHYHGRIDLQIKLNGFRIELGDIEENLHKLDSVAQAAVVPAKKDGVITHLVAHVVSATERTESDFREGLKIKDALKETLPHYMIPKKVVFRDSLPMTGNGKLDRKALQ